MDSAEKRRPSVQESAESVRADLAVFEATEGWEKLSNAQRILIQASLVVTERAKRGAAEEELINRDPFFMTLLRLSKDIRVAHNVISQQIRRINKHAVSKKHVDDYYCNVSAYVVEDIEHLREEAERLEREGLPPTEIPKQLPPDDMLPGEEFFSGERIATRDASAVAEAFKDGGFPYMCHVHFDAADTGGPWRSSFHTFIVLGRRGDELVVWEKVARREPHQRSTLSDVIKKYPIESCNYYYRPMKVSGSQN